MPNSKKSDLQARVKYDELSQLTKNVLQPTFQVRDSFLYWLKDVEAWFLTQRLAPHVEYLILTDLVKNTRFKREEQVLNAERYRWVVRINDPYP